MRRRAGSGKDRAGTGQRVQGLAGGLGLLL